MSPGSERVSRLLPSVSQFLFVLIFLVLSFQAGKGLLNDGDTGYHIRAGELILRTGSVPKADSFSFISPPIPWTAHEWLPEVVMALVHRHFGLTGIVVFFALVISSIYALLFRMMRSSGGNIVLDALVLVLVIVSSTLHWLARPHVFSLLFLVISYFAIDSYQYRERKLIYLMPPLMLIWVNCHGGFIVGFVLLGVYLAGNVFNCLTSDGPERDISRKKAVAILVVAGLCVPFALVSPHGFHSFVFPFKTVSNRFLMDNVTEFLSPNFHNVLPFKYLLYAMFAVAAFSFRRLNVIEFVLVVLFLNMSLYSVRYVPLFATVTGPILSRHLAETVRNLKGKVPEALKARDASFTAIDNAAKGFLWPALAVLMVVALAAQGRVRFGFDESKKPVEAVEFLKRERIGGNMFNNDEFGDYIIYAAYPMYKVFFDGRSDMYGNERLREYQAVAGIKPGWEKVLEKYGVEWVIFNSDSLISRFLLQRPEWHLVYADNVANIFVKKLENKKALIGKYGRVTPVIPDEPGGE